MSSAALPLIPDSAPFTAEQRAWLNGFLAGIFSRGPQTAPTPSAPAVPAEPLAILYGSQTGTAESLAKQAAKQAAQRGFAPALAELGSFDLAKLAATSRALVITSTYGDGEPPDSAKALHAALAAASAQPSAPNSQLAGLRFSVCALGDTNYAKFCQCGKDFDSFLARLGATPTAPRVDCDLDYESAFTGWLDTALQSLTPTTAALPAAPQEEPAPVDAHPTHSRKNPFPAPVLAVRNLNGAGSAKEVNHVEFSLEGSGLAYEAGDALGVFPENCPDLVGEVIATLGCDGEEAVPTPAGEMSLWRALTEHYDLGKPTPSLAKLLTPVTAGVATESVASSAPVRHVIDLLLAAEKKPSLREFVATLRPLQPRLYSISSSPKAHPGHVHLTVGAVRYEAAGRRRKGACSTFLAERALPAGRARVFVHHNNGFRLPADGNTPVIMVGPGTGIAPFRAFLAERRATGAKGKNWLFFGDQRASTDFLYRDELHDLQRAGVLTRLDLAWSRDQTEKIYVQQRMLEHAVELYAWLETGAHFYVCGDASRMAKDVHAALLELLARAGGRTPAEAEHYLQALKTAKRYQRDVY
ncbi:MAG: sulfite reductase subunit alpha [Opitutae bacterium]|nr:sulfite reductase subunit alpha [Opitutae bacterium]